MTTCPRCACSTVLPPITVATAAKLVGQHAAHLDITLDEAAAILAAEHN